MGHSTESQRNDGKRRKYVPVKRKITLAVHIYILIKIRATSKGFSSRNEQSCGQDSDNLNSNICEGISHEKNLTADICVARHVPLVFRKRRAKLP